MSRKKKDTMLLGISVLSFFVLAISFLLMPLDGENVTENASTYMLISGIMFWASIIIGIITQCLLARRRKTWYETNNVKKVKGTQKIGVVSFFKNSYATIADAVAVISLVGLVVALIATQGIGYICYILVSLFVFSFSMHCILNGKVYYYIFNQDKLLKSMEKERANSDK